MERVFQVFYMQGGLHIKLACGHQANFSTSKNILKLSIKLLSIPLQEKENMPLRRQGQRPWRKECRMLDSREELRGARTSATSSAPSSCPHKATQN